MKERNASHAYTLQWFLKSKLTSGRLTLLAIRWKTPDETKCDICNGPWKGPRWHRLNTIKKLSWGYSFPPMQFFKKPTTARHFIKLGKGCTVISALTPSAGFLEIQAVIGFWICTGTLWRTENLPFATDTSLMGLGLTLALGHQRQACVIVWLQLFHSTFLQKLLALPPLFFSTYGLESGCCDAEVDEGYSLK